MDLLIKNGILVTHEGSQKADVVVTDGKVTALMENASLIVEREVKKVIDANGLYILPGCIDPHVHFRDPGHTHKEDFATGSAAAVAGGFTTVYDMPNNNPKIQGIEELKEKLSVISDRSHVDYALYAIIKPDNLDKLHGLIENGVRGFKVMMGKSSMNTPTADDASLWSALKTLRETECPITVHAEDTNICAIEKERLFKENRKDPRAHMESRPVIAETIAIQRAIMLAEDTGGRLHIAHISAGKSVEIIRSAKQRGVKVTCETGPHNLIFTDEDYEEKGAAMFVNPPIRLKGDRDALLAGILDGTVDMIATDHAPHTFEDKYASGHVLKSISGFLGLEASIPIMLTLVNQGKLTLEQYVNLSSVNPAKLFNLFPQKGCIAVGSDADFTIVDMEKETVIDKELHQSKTKITPYDGMKVKGMPVYTIIRGNIAMEDGIVTPKKYGKHV
ncbi:allantoinase AllB [Bacillus timonensis]|nr:allantoinase AllB [Bacillus timonensis]